MIIVQRVSIVSGVLAVDILSIQSLRLDHARLQELSLSAAPARTLNSELFEYHKCNDYIAIFKYSHC